MNNNPGLIEGMARPVCRLRIAQEQAAEAIARHV